MIELIKGNFSEEIKEKLINAKIKAIDEGKILNEKYLVPVQLRNKNCGVINYVGLFKRLSNQDYKDVYEILASQTNTEVANRLSNKLKTKGLFQTVIDACSNSVICPSKEDFLNWANHNQFGVVSIANILLAEGSLEEEASKGDWDFF